MAQQAVSMWREGNGGLIHSPEVARLLRTVLAPTLLGERLQMDFYARNGFRFLGVPAWFDPESLALRCQQFRNGLRVNVEFARRHAIRTIDDGHLDAEAFLAAVAKLESPRHRFCAELFWPHVSESEFAAIQKVGRLDSLKLLQEFKPNGHKGAARAHYLQVNALTYHCLAIEAEFAFLEKRAAAPQGHWEDAIRAWRELWGSDEFWRYMAGRVENMDDPRLKKEDANTARAELPHVILAPQEVFAAKYAETENYEACVRHLSLIAQSGFPEAIVRAATWNAVKRVAGAKLEDLCKRTKQAFGEIKERVHRSGFETVAGPFLLEALSIRDLLLRRLGLAESMLEQSAFDDFADIARMAADAKLKFDGTERQRTILYFSRFLKHLMEMPLSATVCRAIEQTIRQNNHHLYSRFGVEAAALPQVLECFFLKGAESDPEDSVVIPMYRITDRRVEVDKARGTFQTRVFWDSNQILIPRSQQAKQAHGRLADLLQKLTKDHNESQAALRTRYESQITAVEAHKEAELRDLKERFESRMDEANAALQRIDRAEKEALNAEATSSLHRRKSIESAPALSAARSHEMQTRKSLAGIGGALKIEIPAAILLFLAFSFWLEFGVLSAILGIVSAVVAGKVVRTRLETKAASAWAAAEAQLDRAIQAWRRDSESRVAAIRARFAQDRKQPRSVLDGNAHQKLAIAEAGRRQIEEIHKQRDQESALLREQSDRQAGVLKSQIVQQEPAKQLAEYQQFPGYQVALKKGYREGEDPSPSEMAMTSAERAQGLLMLR